MIDNYYLMRFDELKKAVEQKMLEVADLYDQLEEIQESCKAVFFYEKGDASMLNKALNIESWDERYVC